jgi:hypothetical protein
MRIYKDRFYILTYHAGYQQWDRHELIITTGHKAANDRPHVVREWTPTAASTDLFELGDGHVPGHRPIVDGQTAVTWLIANPYQSIYPCRGVRL